MSSDMRPILELNASSPFGTSLYWGWCSDERKADSLKDSNEETDLSTKNNNPESLLQGIYKDKHNFA